jgi:hypothetical protein
MDVDVLEHVLVYDVVGKPSVGHPNVPRIAKNQ